MVSSLLERLVSIDVGFENWDLQILVSRLTLLMIISGSVVSNVSNLYIVLCALLNLFIHETHLLTCSWFNVF